MSEMPKPKRNATGPSRHTLKKKDLDHQMQPCKFFTVGHGTRPVSELLDLLQEHNIQMLVDIRTMPRSRTNPQHNKEKLEEKNLLPAHGVTYHWLGKELGGLRKLDKSLGDLNAGWYNASFRGYADYMQSNEFSAGLQQLFELAKAANGSCALMCAETYYRRCHRSLVSDALTAHGYKVMHITAPGKPAAEHHMTQFAKVEKLPAAKKEGKEKLKITYPPYEETEAKNTKNLRKKDKNQPRIDSIYKKNEK